MQPKYDISIPGYTGYIPSKIEQQITIPSNLSNGCIPGISLTIGYGGYINGVKSENLYGKTYGKITFETGQQLNHWGNDLPENIKYTSSCKEAFQNPTEYKQKDQFTVSREFTQEYERSLNINVTEVQSSLTFEQIQQQAYQ